MHDALLVAPVVVEYVPALQGEHREDPLTAEKVPGGHRVQLGAPAQEYVPDKHCMQTELLIAPCTDE